MSDLVGALAAGGALAIGAMFARNKSRPDANVVSPAAEDPVMARRQVNVSDESSDPFDGLFVASGDMPAMASLPKKPKAPPNLKPMYVGPEVTDSKVKGVTMLLPGDCKLPGDKKPVAKTDFIFNQTEERVRELEGNSA